jgi:acyl carrier protein
VTTIQKITEVIRTVFDDDRVEIGRETTAHDVEGWDSLSHINLIVAIESAFNIKFLNKELLRFKNVGDLVDSVDAKITSR